MKTERSGSSILLLKQYEKTRLTFRTWYWPLCWAISMLSFAELALAEPIIANNTRLERSNRKVILTDIGETISNVGYVGEIVLYRIYYSNESKGPVDIRIVDKLDAGLKNISVKNPGKYDATSHTVAWEFNKLAAGTSGYVEFRGVLKKAGSVNNKARIQFSTVGKLPAFNITKYRLTDIREIIPLAALKNVDLTKRFITIETASVTTRVYNAPKQGWIPFSARAKEGALPKPAMKDSTTIGAMINFDIQGVFVTEVKNKTLTYQRFKMPGQASLTTVGKPELPIIGQVIEVPMGVTFSIEVIKTREAILDHYRVYPAQKPLPDISKSDPLTTWASETFTLDKAAYLNNSQYPGALAMIQTEDIGIIRGHRIIMLKVNPIQYNPVTHETKAYAQIEVRVKYSQPAQVTAIPKRLYSRHFEKLLKNLELNYRDPKRFDSKIDAPSDDGSKERTGCDYLILTINTFYNASDPNNPVIRLANWKQRKGLRTKIVDIANISNGQTYNGIRQYLEDAYNKWDMVPSYVLLIGDADVIPVRYLTAHSSHNNTLVGTDLYYATLDGADIYPDIYIGRLSVDTLAQAATVIDKILNYEQQPPNNANFYNNVIMSALFEDESGNPNDGIEDGTEDRPWIENVEDIRNFILGQNYQVDRIYATSSGWPADPFSSQPMDNENGTALPAALTPPAFQWTGSGNDISRGISAGRFLVTYRDHGNRNSWSSFIGFGNGDVDGLANGNLTPVVFSIACQTGWFDNETDDDTNLAIITPSHPANESTASASECFCEHFLRNNNGGAAAIVGATRNSYTGYNDFLMFGLHKAIWPAYVPNPPTSGYPAIPVMDSNPLLGAGQILTFGKLYMARAYGPSTERTIEFEMYHLFGDPEMPIWTAAPLTFDVNHPLGIGSTAEQDFVVKVTDHNTHAPVTSARVAITRDNALLVVQETDPAGIARFKITAPASGELDVTVTYMGYQPYMGKIDVSASGASINRLDPDNGVAGQAAHVGGINFDGNENVDITFDGSSLNPALSSAGSFGQPSQTDVDIQVPNPHDLGPVNVIAKGKQSSRYGVDVFQVRSQNPIDLYMYNQWDSTTWSLHSGDNPTWDNPSIQLYDTGNNSVSSDNLTAGQTYTIKVDVHNDTDYLAKGVKVTFKWANFGLGQPPQVWTLIEEAEIDVPAHSVVQAQVKWTTPSTGHLCVMVNIYHIEDINTDNNYGQENCHVGPTSSPAKVPVVIWNPTKNPAMVYLDLRQLIDPKPQKRVRLWGSHVIHPDPQLLRPGEKREATIVIDPDAVKDVKSGEEVEYSLTGFIEGQMIGGDNFRIKKKQER